MMKYEYVDTIKSGYKVKGYLLRCETGEEITWRADHLKCCIKDKTVEVKGLKLNSLGMLVRVR